MPYRQIIIEGTDEQLTPEVVGQLLALAALAGAIADVQDVHPRHSDSLPVQTSPDWKRRFRDA